MLKYAVLIPAYNASGTIASLIEQLRQIAPKPDRIIVVDDGSTDKTASICQSCKVDLISLPENKGKGNALKTGFAAFLSHGDIPYLICMDADLQHPVSSIPDFLAAIEEKQAKFIIGARVRSVSSMPVHRIVSNATTSFILSMLTGQVIKDSQCGFRLIHKDVLIDLMLSENGYQLESEIILKTARNGFDIDFIPVPTIYNSEKSYIGHVSDTMRFVRLVFKDLNKRVRWSTKNK